MIIDVICMAAPQSFLRLWGRRAAEEFINRHWRRIRQQNGNGGGA